MLQRILRCRHGVGEPGHIGKDELLTLDVDVIDIVSVDDEASADAHKQFAVGPQLLTNHSLDLTQLESQQACLVVGLHNVAIVAVRRDEDNLVGGNAHQFGCGGYDQKLLEHVSAKVRT